MPLQDERSADSGPPEPSSASVRNSRVEKLGQGADLPRGSAQFSMLLVQGKIDPKFSVEALLAHTNHCISILGE